MKRYPQSIPIYYPLALLLLVAFISSACGAGETTRTTTTKPATPGATQPVSAQQVRSDPIVYVALGASDAVGVGSNQPGSQGYVPLIAQRLPAGSHAINLGISGIHLHEAMKRELPLALSSSPQLITIWLVANDFVAGVPYASYIQDLDALLQQLRAGTRARIAMANLPDLSLLPTFAGLSAVRKAQMHSEIQRWNARIGELAQHYNVTLVDLFGQRSQLTTHPELISADGFHPSSAGYIQLANSFWQAIGSGAHG